MVRVNTAMAITPTNASRERIKISIVLLYCFSRGEMRWPMYPSAVRLAASNDISMCENARFFRAAGVRVTRFRISIGMRFHNLTRFAKKYQLITATTGMAHMVIRYRIFSNLYGF